MENNEKQLTYRDRVTIASEYLVEAALIVEKADLILDRVIMPGFTGRQEQVRDLAKALREESDALRALLKD